MGFKNELILDGETENGDLQSAQEDISPIQQKFGDFLVEYRNKNGLSQNAVAKAIATTRQTVSLWERNMVLPNQYNIKKFCSAYGVSMEEILENIQSGENPTEDPAEEIAVTDDAANLSAGETMRRTSEAARQTQTVPNEKRRKKRFALIFCLFLLSAAAIFVLVVAIGVMFIPTEYEHAVQIIEYNITVSGILVLAIGAVVFILISIWIVLTVKYVREYVIRSGQPRNKKEGKV